MSEQTQVFARTYNYEEKEGDMHGVQRVALQNEGEHDSRVREGSEIERVEEEDTESELAGGHLWHVSSQGQSIHSKSSRVMPHSPELGT